MGQKPPYIDSSLPMKKKSLPQDSPQQESLEAVVWRTVERYALFTPGDTILVGVSGGPDSTALLHLLVGLRNEWGLTLVAAHLNHGFRGAEADADADYVTDLCRALDVLCISERIDVPALQSRRRLSAQVAAREARHAFLRRAAAEYSADRIALGHNRDDRIETILLNLLRGTGLEGLAGFPPIDSTAADSPVVPATPVVTRIARPLLVRPLYDAGRAQIEAYCAAHDLKPRRDSSNEHTDYSRNRIRAELLPYLMSYYNERVGDALLRTAELASADNQLLEAIAAEALAKITQSSHSDSLTVDTAELLALPIALQRRVLRQAIYTKRGSLRDIEFSLIEHTLETLASGGTIDCQLPCADTISVRMKGNSGTLTISRVPAAQSVLPWQIELAVPGITRVPQIKGTVAIRVTPGIKGDTEAGDIATPEYVSGSEADEIPARTRSKENCQAGRRTLFRLQDLVMPLVVRSRRPGDRIHLHGGSKKIQDLLVDAKISAPERDRFPLIVEANGKGRILIAGWLRADISAITKPLKHLSEPNSEELIRIEFRFIR